MMRSSVTLNPKIYKKDDAGFVRRSEEYAVGKENLTRRFRGPNKHSWGKTRN